MAARGGGFLALAPSMSCNGALFGLGCYDEAIPKFPGPGTGGDLYLRQDGGYQPFCGSENLSIVSGY